MSKSYVPKALRQKVRTEAHYRCGYCLSSEKITGMPMDVEHILPEALGGLTQENNLWLACSLCNALKGYRTTALDPENGYVVPLFNPRQQIWAEHFSWTVNGEEIIGKTPIGRATTVALQLNRKLLLEARKTWIIAKVHPPRS